MSIRENPYFVVIQTKFGIKFILRRKELRGAEVFFIVSLAFSCPLAFRRKIKAFDAESRSFFEIVICERLVLLGIRRRDAGDGSQIFFLIVFECVFVCLLDTFLALEKLHFRERLAF